MMAYENRYKKLEQNLAPGGVPGV